MPGRVKQGRRPPWVGLGAAVWVQIAAGSAFTFPLYSHSLKSVLGFNQQQLTFLGVANDIGENVGILPGVVCNHLAPWIVLLIGSACAFLGFGVIWLAVSQTVTNIPYLLLWFALCVATNSSAWLGTGVLVTNMRNFPLSRGAVAGIMKGYVALSAAVYTEIYTGLNDSSSNLLLFLAIGIPAICFMVMYFVRPCTPSLEDDSMEHGHFQFVQVASIILGLYLISLAVVRVFLPVEDAVTYGFFGGMVLILLAPFAIPLKMTFFPATRKPAGSISRSSSSQSFDSEQDKCEPLLAESPSLASLSSLADGGYPSDVDVLLAVGEGAVRKKRRPRRGEDFEFHEALVKADFWLLFLTYFTGVGSGVTVLNNLGQIGVSGGVQDTSILLCLFSFFNFAGRLSGGVISEHFVRSRMLPRPIWMALTQMIMVFAYLIFAFLPSTILYLATALLGTCYGVQFSVMVPTVSELFGLKHFGIFYNLMLIGNPLGAFLFSGLLAGYVYDQEAAKQHAAGLMDEFSSSCFGAECFRLTFLVLAGVCAIGSVLATVLTMRVKPVYQMLYAGGSFRVPRSPR